MDNNSTISAENTKLYPEKEDQITAPDKCVDEISRLLIEKNIEAYKELAK